MRVPDRSRGFWLRWSLRDLRRRWLFVAAISLLVAVGTGLATGLGSQQGWRVDSADASYALLDYHDVHVTLSEGSFAAQGQLTAIVDDIGDAAIAAVEERLVVATQVDASTDAKTILVPGRIVGVAPGAQVDRIAVTRGRALEPRDDGQPVAVLEASFAEHHGLPTSGSVAIAGGTRLETVGQGRAPEEFLILPPGGWGGEASLAVLYLPLRSAQTLTGHQGAVNDLVVRAAASTTSAVLRGRVEQALAERAPGLGATVTLGTDDDVYGLLYEDASNDQQIMTVIALIVLAGAALAAFNLISRIVESERREIGIGMALGVPPARLAIRPLLLAAEIALLGAVLGVAVGFAVRSLLRGVLADQLPLPVLETPFEPAIFARGAILGFVIPFVAAALPVWRGLRVSPIEAIEVGARSARSGRVLTLAGHLGLPGRSLAQMPVRNVLRTPRRTLLTVLGLAAVVTVVVSLLGTLDSFSDAIDRSDREVTRVAPARMTADLSGFVPVGSPLVSEIVASPAVGEAEPGLRLAATVSTPASSFDIALELLDPARALWVPSVSHGTLASELPSVVLAEKAASDLGVRPGDAVMMRHPRAVGPTSYELVDTQMRISGVHPSPFRFVAFIDSRHASLFGLAGVTNTITLTPAPGTSQDAVERALFPLSGVAAVQPVTTTTDTLRDAIDDSFGALRISEAFALVLAFLLAFNASGINAEERTREYATMFAFGLPVRSVVATSILEGLIVGLLGTAAGIGIGLVVLDWMASDLLPEVLPDIGVRTTLSAASLVIAAAVGAGAMAVAPLFTRRRLARLDIPSALRVVE